MFFPSRRWSAAGCVLACLCGLSLVSSTACAAGPIQVKSWAEATPPGAEVGVAYLELLNLGTTPDRLLRVTSPAAGRLSLHQSMKMAGMAHMRPLDGVALPPGAMVRFAPGADHVMLEQLRQPLRIGDSLPLTLIFEHAAPLTVVAPVRAIGEVKP